MSSNLTRGSQRTIDINGIQDGKIRFAIDTARLFFDTRTERIEITDIVKGLKYSEIIRLRDPLPKVYLSSDTRQILLYDNDREEWITYGGGSIDPGFYIVDLYYNEDGDTVLEYGDGSIQIRENPKIKELEAIIERYSSAIEIEKVEKPQEDDEVTEGDE